MVQVAKKFDYVTHVLQLLIMTRITNFGRKRTYLEAGFRSANIDEGRSESQGEIISKAEGEAGNLPKKPRKRRRKKTNIAVHGEEPINTDQARTIVEEGKQITMKKARSGEKRKRDEEHIKGMPLCSSICSSSCNAMTYPQQLLLNVGD